MNISVGYAFEHTDKEVISKKHYRNAVNYVYDLLVGMGEVKWEHVYTAPVYKASNPTSARQTSLFDWSEPISKLPEPPLPSKGLEEEEEKPLILTEQDNWMLDTYPEFNDVEQRHKLKHIKCDDIYLTPSLPKQEVIDDMIDKGICPVCRGDIKADNVLNLTTVCTDCFSVFNIPPDDYEFYKGSMKEELFPRGTA